MIPQDLLAKHGIAYIATRKGKFTTKCPACGGGYLNVECKRDGVVWYCHHCQEGGGEQYEKTNGKGGDHSNLGPIKATFDYTDETGRLLYQVLRFEPINAPKQFRQRTGPDQQNWSIKGVRIVPYRLPELIEAVGSEHIVFVVEGEKDVETLRRHGVPATCNPMGAGKWRPEFNEIFRDADVVICGDNDAPGRDHVQLVLRNLRGVAKRIRVLDLTKFWPEIEEGDDISDWFAGHAREQLDELIEQAPDYAKPRPSVNDGTAFGYSWHLIWHGEDSSTSVRKWLVQDLLPETGVALISGQWGTYKTFVAIDLSAAVMTATTFTNKPVMREGGVLFVACEGQNEVDIRFTAAFRQHGGKGNAPFAWVQDCPRLLDPDAGKILAAMVNHAAAKMMQDFGLPVAMVIIDTAGKAAGLSKPGELNDDAVAKVIMAALAEASIQTGALFIGVAHFGKNVEVGTKGSTGFEDDADVVLALLGERGINGVVNNPVLCARKRRSGPNGEEFAFQTEEADIDPDEQENGIVERTLTIRWTDAADGNAATDFKKKKDDPWAVKSLRHLRQTMMNMVADCGSEQRPYPDGPIVRAVDIETVRAEFYKSYPATGDEAAKKEARRKAFNRAIGIAHHKRLIGTRDIGATTFVWLTNPSH